MKLIKLIADLSLSRLTVLALLTTVAYFFTYFDDGTSLEAQIAASSSSVQTETARRVGIEKIMKKEEEMRGNILQLARNLEVVKTKIPFEFKDSQMSTIVNAASEASGVSLVEMSTNPVKSVAQNLPQAAINDQSTIKPEDLVSEVRFNITISGSYDSFMKFLEVLTKEDKIIKLRNFTIEKNSTNIDDDTIKFKGEVIGYKQAAGLLSGVGAK
jgi:Tfp pilus assembly protein PilO